MDLGFRVSGYFSPILENQMEKKLEKDMETREYVGVI